MWMKKHLCFESRQSTATWRIGTLQVPPHQKHDRSELRHSIRFDPFVVRLARETGSQDLRNN